MKLNTLLAALILLAVAGCASTDQWRAEEIPVPRTTPFDSNEFARNAYLEGFRSGYRARLNREPNNVEVVVGPNQEARRQGYYAGYAHAAHSDIK